MPAYEKKKTFGLVCIGHVDAGKSTLLGNFIYQVGGVDERSLHRLEKMAAHAGKSSFKFAWLLDKQTKERERGITIDPAVWMIETANSVVSLHDAPGHRDFVKNMVTAASQADAAILVVSAMRGEFESGISREGQTREHALLAYTLGIKQLVVACNKMDCSTVEHSEERYQEVVRNTSTYLKKIGFKEENITFIPVSALSGDNLVSTSANTPWYTGPTLIEAIDAFSLPERYAIDPLRVPVKDVFKIGGIGTVLTGVVQTGTMYPLMPVTLAPAVTPDNSPSAIESVVKSIESHHRMLEEATPGTGIGFNVKRVNVKDLRPGCVCSDSRNDPVRIAKSFQARIVLMNHPGLVREGYTPLIHCHTSHVACRFESIESKIDRKTGVEIEKNPNHISQGDAAVVRCVPVKPMVVEKYSQSPSLGRFAIRDMNQVIGIGIILDVAHHDKVTIEKRV